ncbi:MAG: hypothetical protein QM785_15760 [Pyrinomonadaceae bacterium]
MRKFLRLRLMFYVFCILSVAFASGQAKSVLTNSDVAAMIKGNLPESTIVLSIQQSQGSKFDTSPAALIQLKNDGASDKILDAIVLATKPVDSSDRVAVVDAGIRDIPKENFEDVIGYFRVSLVDGAAKKDLKWVPYDSKTYSGKKKIPYAGIFFKKDTYFKIPGSYSDFKVANMSPQFEVTLTSGAKAAAIVNIVKLEVTSTARKIMVAQEGTFRSTKGIRPQDIYEANVEEIRSNAATGFTQYRLTPKTNLKPGEYAIVANGTQFYDFTILPTP